MSGSGTKDDPRGPFGLAEVEHNARNNRMRAR